ncbi:MAG: hypothetical protein WBB07_12665 [Mycobacterium sp.]
MTRADIPAVAQLFHRELSSGAAPEAWCRVMDVPWAVEQPNHGYLLRDNTRVVGAYHAFYSERVIDGRRHQICNLGAWCVEDKHRAAGLRMLRALLRQPGYTFTDLSPSGNVPALNTRLGFAMLDTQTAVIPNLPWPWRSQGVRVIDGPKEMDELLCGQEQQIYRDHRETVVNHVVLVKGDRHCYLVFRRETRRHLRVFASILYVSDPELFRECAPHLYRYLLLRHGMAATLVELRVLGYRPARSVMTAGCPKMYLSEDLAPGQVDYLYSELTCRAW